MRKGSILVLVFFLLASAAVFAGGQKDGEAGKEGPRALNFSHVFQTNHPVHIAVSAANESLKQKTDGRLSLQIYPNSTYASYNDAVSAVRMGSLDMCPLDSASDWLPKAGVVLGPYVFRSYEHWKNFKASDLYTSLREEIGKAMGVVQLDMYNFGFRHLTGNKIFRNLSDFNGIVLRVVDFPPYSELATIFNASVTATPIAEVYMALQSGVVDAEENPVTQITTMKFFEVQKYLMLSAHMLAVSGTIVADGTWKSLSPADQQILRDIFKVEADQIDDIVVKNEESLIKQCEESGMIIIRDIDTTPFRERVPLVLKKYPDWVDVYNQIQKLKG
ncbi:MAG: TRAP transporter substrate-binding protein [Spirochaetales bacterium]|jgi:tripartite ATP-independent transporter DctP family solute receptor|nr:TRAP transporter substrate-binding protein [Spirochaetales bacterium]